MVCIKIQAQSTCQNVTSNPSHSLQFTPSQVPLSVCTQITNSRFRKHDST